MPEALASRSGSSFDNEKIDYAENFPPPNQNQDVRRLLRIGWRNDYDADNVDNADSQKQHASI